MSTPVVAVVIVSHSDLIARGVVELAAQMAGSTRIEAAGGTDEGGIGTSFDTVSAAILKADESAGAGGGVVVLCDLGSAILTAETALDFLGDELRSRVAIADAPIVEGAVAAAVAAESGAGLTDVVAAAQSAFGDFATPLVEPAETSNGDLGALDHRDGAPAEISATTTLVNRDGLHARPAADFVKLASTFDAVVSVNGVDAKSLLRIMSLGLGAGSTVTIRATGAEASDAVGALVALVESGFGEPGASQSPT
ncbi:MAG: hypothetical protein RI885_1551 [Actinomycetota bacterium]